MILLFYALYSSINDCVDQLVYGNAKATVAKSYGGDDCNPGNVWCDPGLLGRGWGYEEEDGTQVEEYSENWGWYYAGKWDCAEGFDGEKEEAKVWMICDDTDQGKVIVYSGYLLVGLSSIYAICILLYVFCRAPKYGTVDYYAYLVMVKRAKYFKRFIRFMYVIIALILILFLLLLIWYYIVSENFLPEVIGQIVSTLILSGLSVAELRRTNEINFKYDIPDNKDQDFSKPIYLSPKCCCNCVTAEDFFEQLEEAVLVYSVTGNSKLLKLCLKEDTDEECERVMNYYKHIFNEQEIEMGDSAEKNAKQSIELGTMIDTAASTVGMASNEA